MLLNGVLSGQIVEKRFSRRKLCSWGLLTIFICGALSSCQRSIPDSYWRDAQTCLDKLEFVDRQIDAGLSHTEVAPHMVTAKITIEDFENRYDRQGLPDLNREIKSALDSYLDFFMIDNTIYLKLPILQGSVIEQQLSARYPEVANQKEPSSGAVKAAIVLPIVRQRAQQHAETARRWLVARETSGEATRARAGK